MAKYIELESATQAAKEPTIYDLTDVPEWLSYLPTADVAPVVRCGECERRSKSADLTDTIYCKWLSLQMPKDAFCSYGERKGGEGRSLLRVRFVNNL